MTKEEISKLPKDVRLQMALADMSRAVIEEHKRFNMPLIEWRDGQIVRTMPDEAEKNLKSDQS